MLVQNKNELNLGLDFFVLEKIWVKKKKFRKKINWDVEENQEDKRDVTTDEEVEVNEINLDIKRIKSERGWCNLFHNLKLKSQPNFSS